MTKSLIALAALLALSTPTLGADSPCKGLEQTQCATIAGCRWQAAQVKGEASKKGTPYARNVKAHCRKGKAQVAKS
jgi:hypothetical protein